MLKDWLKSKQQPAQDSVQNAVYLKLYQAQRARAFLDVTIEDDDVVYQSMMLELDPVEQTILIDELFPRGFVGMPGQAISVAVRQGGGKKIVFKSEILEHHLHDDAPLYVIRMPRELASDQRRKAFRLPIANRLAIQPSFVFPDQRPSRGLLKNVSTSGVAMQLAGDYSDTLHRGDLLKDIEFDFAGVGIRCDLAIRNVLVDGDSEANTLVGGEFLGLPSAEQELLSRSILRVQRQRLKSSVAAEQHLI